MEYKFNDCGVCINPTIYGEVQLKKHLVTTNKIKIAQLPSGKWVFGWDYESDNMDGAGYCCGCFDSPFNDKYNTKREAVLAGAKWFRAQAAKEAAYYKTPYNKMIECADLAEKQLFNEQQLSLF